MVQYFRCSSVWCGAVSSDAVRSVELYGVCCAVRVLRCDTCAVRAIRMRSGAAGEVQYGVLCCGEVWRFDQCLEVLCVWVW